jgi:hypothetical protein
MKIACLSLTSGIVFTAWVARLHSPVGRSVSSGLSDSVSSPSSEDQDQLHDHDARFLYHARDHVSTIFRSRHHFFSSVISTAASSSSHSASPRRHHFPRSSREDRFASGRGRAWKDAADCRGARWMEAEGAERRSREISRSGTHPVEGVRCRESDSNRHGARTPRDFKSLASTRFAIPARAMILGEERRGCQGRGGNQKSRRIPSWKRRPKRRSASAWRAVRVLSMLKTRRSSLFRRLKTSKKAEAEVFPMAKLFSLRTLKL